MARHQTCVAVLLLALALAVPSADANHECSEACWEQCFKTLNTENERYREVYDDILEIALEITQLKNNYNVTKIAWLVDTALSSRHIQNEIKNTGNLENGKNTYRFELLLLQALVLTINSQKNYFIQYDEQSAWGCNEFSCVGNAAATCPSVAQIKYLTQLEMNPTSHCPGNIEAACKLANNLFTDITCADTNSNTMVVAIANGDFHINDRFRREKHHSGSSSSDEDHICPPYQWGGLNAHSSSDSSSDEHDFFSPCHSYFNSRYVIGTHTAKREDVEPFKSKHGNYRYIHDEEFSLDALNNLVYCMTQSTACCTAVTAVPVTTCKKTQGPYGEVVNSWPTHPAIGAAAAINSLPVDPASASPVVLN